MNDYKEYLKTKQYSWSTIDAYMKAVRMYFEWLEGEELEVTQITYNDLLVYIKYCNKQGITRKTMQTYMMPVKHYYDHLIREEIMVSNPASGIEIKGVKRKVLYHILEPHQLNRLYYEYPDQSDKDRRNKVMLGLLVYQGLRTEELSRLTTKQIKLREGKIDVLGSRKHNGRLLELESHQIMDMYDYVLNTRREILTMEPKRKSQKRQQTEQLFIGEGGNCYSLNNFMTQLMIKVRKIDPSVRNAQQIRASVITKWVKGYNLRKAQYLAGHRYISTTEGYLQNDMEGLKEEVEKFHPM